MVAVAREPVGAAPPERPSASDGALVLADPGELRDRLVDELAVFGYRPLIHAGPGPPPDGARPWVVLLAATEDVDAAAARARDLRAAPEYRAIPLLWLVSPHAFTAVADHEQLCDEFIGVPYPMPELAARLRMLRMRTGRDGPEVIRRDQLTINLATYQATLQGRVLDLTYMEYELLKLLARHPGRVYTREEILAHVWGFDYFGGMRTVDVHVRRLRAKLGQDHAWLIETVRSVGYRFSQVHP
jgi:DNA-binding response OmpR family regulator